MKDETYKISKGYIMGQAITYFFLSILLIRETVLLNPETYGSDMPFFYIGKLGIVPFPMLNLHIDFTYWIMFILGFICLGLSVFFFIILFCRPGVLSKVTGFALYLSSIFSFLVFISFVLSWATGLTSVMKDIKNPVVTGIFSYAGILIFFALFIRVILNMDDPRNNIRIFQYKFSISKMRIDPLPCL